MASILIVDDQRAMRILLKGVLGLTGHELHLAEDGLEALDILGAQSIDLLITDINMPKMDGLELLSRLQERANLIKLVMSAQDSPDATSRLEARLESLGVADFFEKPLDIKGLRRRVEELLSLPQP